MSSAERGEVVAELVQACKSAGVGSSGVKSDLQVRLLASFTSSRASCGAPATLNISISLARGACQNLMWSRLSVRRTTMVLVEWSSFKARRKSYDVLSSVSDVPVPA